MGARARKVDGLSDRTLDRRTRRLFFLAVVLFTISFLIFLCQLINLGTLSAKAKGLDFLPVSIHAESRADYSGDQDPEYIPPINENILIDLIMDIPSTDTSDERVATLRSVLLTPVPSMTPAPAFTADPRSPAASQTVNLASNTPVFSISTPVSMATVTGSAVPILLTPTRTSSPIPTQTSSQTHTVTYTPTASRTLSSIVVRTSTPRPTATRTRKPTARPTRTRTFTPSNTYTPTASDTGMPIFTPTSPTAGSYTPSSTDTFTPAATETGTPTFTPTETLTGTQTNTPTSTDTFTPAASPTETLTFTPTPTGDTTPVPTPEVQYPVCYASVPDGLLPSDDTFIKSESPTKNFGSEEIIEIRPDKDANRRGFIRFDLSSIPPGAVITNAALYLYEESSSPDIISNIYRVTSDWGENSATWLSWAVPGGDFDESISYYAFVPYQAGCMLTLDITALVQAWVEGIYPNYGFTLLSTGPNHLIYYSSKENSVESQRPKLDITFSAP